MPSLPRDYTIVRKGEPCQVTVRNAADLIRLRSKLDLVASGGPTSVDDAQGPGLDVGSGETATAEHATEQPVPANPLCATRTETSDLTEEVGPAAEPPEPTPVDPANGGRMVDELEASFNHLGQFFVLHANRLWHQARLKLEEAVQFAEQTRAAHDQARAMLAELETWRAKAAEAAETVQVHCQQAANCRDEAQRALEGTARDANEAENATNQTLPQAKQARKGPRPRRRAGR